mmetsp:Transcript_57016/g.135631  ORF Transcript_57016/g.135631 Transcript_57016/m.135631 type:complete len:217 (+) Transcript_57016:1829-2479(+)
MLFISWRLFRKLRMMNALTTAAEKLSSTAHMNMKDSCLNISRSFERHLPAPDFVKITGTPSNGTQAMVPPEFSTSKYGRNDSKIAHCRSSASCTSSLSPFALVGGHWCGTPSNCTTISSVTGQSIPTEKRINHSTGNAKKASVDKTCQDPTCEPGPCTQTRAIQGAEVEETCLIQPERCCNSAWESCRKLGCVCSAPLLTLMGALPSAADTKYPGA